MLQCDLTLVVSGICCNSTMRQDHFKRKYSKFWQAQWAFPMALCDKAFEIYFKQVIKAAYFLIV